MDITSGDTKLGRLLIELYDETCPKTVAQFLRFVRGAEMNGTRCSYQGTAFTRVLLDGWMQGGGERVQSRFRVLKSSLIFDVIRNQSS